MTINRLQNLFKKKQTNILSIYFSVGYPKLDSTNEIILSLEKSGADFLEAGLPFSDPLADGPVIQESSTKAIENGMTTALYFSQIKEVRKVSNIPIVFMGYFNQVYQMGVKEFCWKCRDSGIDGAIIPDLPLDIYESEYKHIFDEYEIPVCFLITPQTTEERICQIDQLTTGFVYIVSDSSITGSKQGFTDKQLAYFGRINNMKLQSPQMIGFGISDNKTFQSACDYANGAIIGSAFIKAISQDGDLSKNISRFVNSIK